MDHQLLVEIQSIKEQHELGNLSEEERDYLLTEIRDIRAAQECAGDEVLFRYVCQTCNIIMRLV